MGLKWILFLVSKSDYRPGWRLSGQDNFGETWGSVNAHHLFRTWFFREDGSFREGYAIRSNSLRNEGTITDAYSGYNLYVVMTNDAELRVTSQLRSIHPMGCMLK